MRKLKKHLQYFSKAELLLWAFSMLFIIGSFLMFDRENYLTLAASVIGGTSLIFNAKGNPLGQLLIIIFSVIYGYISFTCAYYGEMITYLGMTAPMALFSLISWLRHPFKGNKAEVAVNRIRVTEVVFMVLLTGVVTLIFYFILDAFHTANISLSTLSVTTSFLAVYLTFRRSAYYAIGYAANDLVLIVLWVMATVQNPAYLSVVICFVTFFVNDMYGFFSWRKIYRRQNG